MQELVAGFAGTVILISHDRDFLDRTVTSIIAPEGNGKWLEYAGGYSDMLLQRKASEAEAKKPVASGAPTATKPTPKLSAKLSYKQKFALETLPGKIETATKAVATLEAKLSDGNLFAKDPAQFSKIATELDVVRASIDTMEHEWLELEMLKSEVEGQ